VLIGREPAGYQSEDQSQNTTLEVSRSIFAGVSEAFSKYVKNNCDEKGEIKKDNMNASQRAGLRKLRSRAARGELVIQTSDKSNKLVVMKPEDYKEAAMKHFDKDEAPGGGLDGGWAR
jgi:hypothetical protein